MGGRRRGRTTGTVVGLALAAGTLAGGTLVAAPGAGAGRTVTIADAAPTTDPWDMVAVEIDRPD